MKWFNNPDRRRLNRHSPYARTYRAYVGPATVHMYGFPYREQAIILDASTLERVVEAVDRHTEAGQCTDYRIWMTERLDDPDGWVYGSEKCNVREFAERYAPIVFLAEMSTLPISARQISPCDPNGF